MATKSGDELLPEASRWLDEQWDGFLSMKGRPPAELQLDVPLHPDEAEFLLAVNGPRSVVKMGPNPGDFQLVGIDPARSSKSKYRLFSDPPSLNRQYLMQVVALRRLTNDYGWYASELQFEREKFDVSAWRERSIVIGAIVDKSASELGRRIERIKSLVSAADPAPPNSTDARIAESVRLHRPEVLWCVAPGRSEAFDVVAGERGIELSPRRHPSPAVMKICPTARR